MIEVLLLITGVGVVGPIQAQQTNEPIVCDPSFIIQCGRFRPETLPEVCARAMKEIGATPPRVINAGTQAEIELPGKLYGKEVFCIPAPTGLKR